MESVVRVAIIVGAVLIPLAVLLGVLSIVISAVRRKALAAIEERFGGTPTVRAEPMANFMGQQSIGPAAARGNGALVLTDEVIWFRLVVPARELEIPLEKVTGVRIEKWFLGKTKGRPMVIVDFDLGNGPDAAAWFVREPDHWRDAILAKVPS